MVHCTGIVPAFPNKLLESWLHGHIAFLAAQLQWQIMGELIYRRGTIVCLLLSTNNGV